MIPLLVAALGGVVSALAFPRFGPGVLIVPGIGAGVWALRHVTSRRDGFLVGLIYGLVFFLGVMWWSIELGVIALVPLALLQGLWFGGMGWLVAGWRDVSPGRWVLLATSTWALTEFLRYRFPFSGLEWGGAVYALSANEFVRAGASIVGGSGWTVLLVALAASLTVARVNASVPLTVLGLMLLIFVLGLADAPAEMPEELVLARVAIVQGSTPCPYEKCAPNERLQTYKQHLELTRQLPVGNLDLVVWAEGSTGSVNADPVNNPEIGAAIAEEARRIGAWFLVGSDRPISETEWINANVVFDDSGQIVGEYRKQQGVPFGEYIPFRPLFDWIPDLDQVPRDMVPGSGPVVFDLPNFDVGSVISFEGSFSRYARSHVLAGAELMVVATNEGSYGTTSVSDQLIFMTRMRAAELGVPVVHAAVTGKSVVIDASGALASDTSGLGTTEIILGNVAPGVPTFYARVGDWVMYAAILGGILLVWHERKLLVSTAEVIRGGTDVGSA